MDDIWKLKFKQQLNFVIESVCCTSDIRHCWFQTATRTQKLLITPYFLCHTRAEAVYRINEQCICEKHTTITVSHHGSSPQTRVPPSLRAIMDLLLPSSLRAIMDLLSKLGYHQHWESSWIFCSSQGTIIINSHHGSSPQARVPPSLRTITNLLPKSGNHHPWEQWWAPSIGQG